MTNTTTVKDESKPFFSRYFLIDSVCAQVKGHNLVSLGHFRSLINNLTRKESQTLCVASKHLLKTAEKSNLDHIDPALSFYYGDIQLLSDEAGQRYYPSLYPYQIPIKMPFSVYKNSYSNAELKCITVHHREIEQLAHIEMTALLDKYQACRQDCIFFPSADIYAVTSIAKILAEQHPSQSPVIIFKFIHVMEYWSPLFEDSLEFIFLTIKELLNQGHDIRICTEAPGYSDYIQNKYALHSIPLPLPIPPSIEEGLQEFNCNSRIVLFPGTQRFDKGLARIPEIISKITEQTGLSGAKFIIQEPTHNDLNGSAEIYNEIMKYPNVIVLPSSIQGEKLRSLYFKSKCVCLPYQESTYDLFRSSGSYIEAASYCRPITATDCKGFSATFTKHRLGKLASSEVEIARSVINMLEWSIEDFLTHKSFIHSFFESIISGYASLLSVNYNAASL